VAGDCEQALASPGRQGRAGGALLAVAAPLMAGMMIAVRLRTGQMALFRQARVTGQRKVASIIKLRTLTPTPAGRQRSTARWDGGCGRPIWTSCPS
jgi:hypothetical protein